MAVNVLDIINGTLILSDLASREVKLPKEEKEEDEAENPGNPIDKEDLKKTLSGVVQEQASKVMKELNSFRWSGRVLSASEGGVVVNAGKDVGLKVGSVFDVYARGDAIRSVNGSHVFLLGDKVGELKTVEVMERYASTVPLFGEEFRPGQIVKIKN